MTEDKDKESGYDGQGLKGPLYWLASAATASAIKGPGGILGNLLGGNPPPPPPGGEFVTREVLDLTTENQGLKSQLYTSELDKRQSVWNATQQGRIDCMQRQLDQLFGLTQLTVPNAHLNPGYGPAVVGPAPVPAFTVPPAVESTNASIANSIATAVATAVASAMKDAA